MLRDEVNEVLKTLTPREAKVIRLRFGLTDDGAQRTLEEVGAFFNVTRERIRQIEAKALRQAPPPHAQHGGSRRTRNCCDGGTRGQPARPIARATRSQGLPRVRVDQRFASGPPGTSVTMATRIVSSGAGNDDVVLMALEPLVRGEERPRARGQVVIDPPEWPEPAATLDAPAA
jgi:hypothetical protein